MSNRTISATQKCVEMYNAAGMKRHEKSRGLLCGAESTEEQSGMGVALRYRVMDLMVVGLVGGYVHCLQQDHAQPFP